MFKLALPGNVYDIRRNEQTHYFILARMRSVRAPRSLGVIARGRNEVLTTLSRRELRVGLPPVHKVQKNKSKQGLPYSPKELFVRVYGNKVFLEHLGSVVTAGQRTRHRHRLRQRVPAAVGLYTHERLLGFGRVGKHV